MPLYEYQCKKCRHRFEKIQQYSDKPIKKCPECGGPVEKLLSAPAVQFKGTGWYVTDYPKKSASQSSSADGGNNGTTASDGNKSGAKSEGGSKTDGSGSTDSGSKGEKSQAKESKSTAESSSSKKSHKK